MASFLRILADFGDAAGWLVAAVVAFACARRILTENDRAHTVLADGVKANGQAIAALRGEVQSVAANVAVLMDRVERRPPSETA